MKENTSKFPLTTILALGCWRASSILYLFPVFLSSNCNVIYNSSQKKPKKTPENKTNHQTELAYSNNYDSKKEQLIKHPVSMNFPSEPTPLLPPLLLPPL